MPDLRGVFAPIVTPFRLTDGEVDLPWIAAPRGLSARPRLHRRHPLWHQRRGSLAERGRADAGDRGGAGRGR